MRLSVVTLLRFCAFFLFLIGILSLFTPISLVTINLGGDRFLYGYLDFVCHFLLFHLGAWMVMHQSYFPRRPAWVVLVIAGIASELVQHSLLDSRSGSVSDAVLNVSGVISALFVIKVMGLDISRRC